MGNETVRLWGLSVGDNGTNVSVGDIGVLFGTENDARTALKLYTMKDLARIARVECALKYKFKYDISSVTSNGDNLMEEYDYSTDTDYEHVLLHATPMESELFDLNSSLLENSEIITNQFNQWADRFNKEN